MSFIKVDNITKTFKVAKRNSGLKAALKSFFKREYKYVNAVKNVSFEIKKGEVIGYIGPNGAGKSTTIKMLSGILLPTSGSIKINNLDPIKDRKKYVSKIGVVFGQRSQLAFDIPAEDTFDLLRDIYKIDNNEYQKTKKYLVELLGIEEIIKKPVRTLSLGERMRCEIASSLLHKPEILFLDEPTIGLDAISKKIVRDFIKKINKENTDNKDMLEEMKKVLEGNVEEVKLTNKLKSHPVCLTTTGEVSTSMEKVINAMPTDEKIKANEVLEINASHKIVDKLKDLYKNNKDEFTKYTKVIYYEARLIEGLPIDNPTELSNLMCDIMANK